MPHCDWQNGSADCNRYCSAETAGSKAGQTRSVHQQRAKAPVVHQEAKRLQTQAAAADVFVPVHATSLRLLAVVQVKRLQTIQTDEPVELAHCRPILLLGTKRIPSRENMAGVEAN